MYFITLTDGVDYKQFEFDEGRIIWSRPSLTVTFDDIKDYTMEKVNQIKDYFNKLFEFNQLIIKSKNFEILDFFP